MSCREVPGSSIHKWFSGQEEKLCEVQNETGALTDWRKQGCVPSPCQAGIRSPSTGFWGTLAFSVKQESKFQVEKPKKDGPTMWLLPGGIGLVRRAWNEENHIEGKGMPSSLSVSLLQGTNSALAPPLLWLWLCGWVWPAVHHAYFSLPRHAFGLHFPPSLAVQNGHVTECQSMSLPPMGATYMPGP